VVVRARTSRQCERKKLPLEHVVVIVVQSSSIRGLTTSWTVFRHCVLSSTDLNRPSPDSPVHFIMLLYQCTFGLWYDDIMKWMGLSGDRLEHAGRKKMAQYITMLCLKNVACIIFYNLEKHKPVFLIFGTQYPDNPSF